MIVSMLKLRIFVWAFFEKNVEFNNFYQKIIGVIFWSNPKELLIEGFRNINRKDVLTQDIDLNF